MLSKAVKAMVREPLSHRRDIHNRSLTLCGESAGLANCARDWEPSRCEGCEAVHLVLNMRDFEDWSPSQARAALDHAGWNPDNLEERPWHVSRQ